MTEPASSSLLPVDFDPFAGGSPLALTEAQREMYAAAQMSVEASCGYNQCFALRLRGALSVSSLQRALAQVVERHDALRVRVVGDGEGQEILDAVEVALPVVDLSGLTDAACQAEISRLLDHEASTPFDLSAAPLWRAQVVHEPAGRHRLIFTAHHLVCDGWSSAVLFTDLANAYVADRFGMPARLAPAASFRAFVEADAAAAAVAEAEAAEAFWVERYASGVPSFELPLDRPRPRLKTYAAAREVFRIDAAPYLALRKMSAQQGCTLFVTMLAAFEALLARLSGCEDLVIGVPMASQALLENGHLVAHGVNTIPLRCHAALESPFSEHLKAARRTFLDAQAHQRLTFGSLVRRLRLPRDPSRTPLVNVIFNIDRLGAPFDFGELALEGIEAPKAFNNFELSINAVDSGTDLVLECDYNVAVFDASSVRRWLALYGAALERAAADPSLPLAVVFAPGAGEMAMLAAFNRTEADWPRDVRVETLIERQVAATPERIAVTVGDRNLSYRELDGRANAVAAKLRLLGVGKGSLVGLSCGRNEHMFVGLVGILKAGAGYVPLDPDFPADRLAFMVTDAGLRQVVSDRSVRDGLLVHGVACLVVDELGAQDEAPAPCGSADDVAYVIYTSGSTGRPKGVLVPHRTVTNLLESVRKEPGMTAGRTVLSVTTLSFDIAVSEVIMPLTVGARVVVADREQAANGARLRELVESQQIDFIDATPSSWRLLLAAGWEGSSALTAICTGEPMPPDLGQALLPRVGQLWNGYGPTETTVWSSFHRVLTIDGPVPIGRPIANTAIHVMDAQLRLVPVGVTGELFIGGAGVTQGYLGRPDLTAERFVSDPLAAGPKALLYKTGDLGRWRADGVLECLGRIDHQVKVRGYRIELGEIEANLLTHPQVAQAVALVHQDSAGDHRLAAFVVPRGAMPSASVLREHLRAMLPQYMLPQQLVQIDAIPLLPNGKIDRRALRVPASLPSGAAPSLPNAAASARPLSEAEQAVALIWQRLLSVEEVRANDNFFDLGGHSLLAVQAVAEMRRQLGLRIDLRRLTFESLGQLAASPGQTGAGSTPQAVEPKGLLGRWIGSLRGQANAD